MSHFSKAQFQASGLVKYLRYIFVALSFYVFTPVATVSGPLLLRFLALCCYGSWPSWAVTGNFVNIGPVCGGTGWRKGENRLSSLAPSLLFFLRQLKKRCTCRWPFSTSTQCQPLRRIHTHRYNCISGIVTVDRAMRKCLSVVCTRFDS